MSIPLIAINRLLWDPAELIYIIYIMLKLCFNPNYKQVLGALSRPVSSGSTPGHCAHCCAQGVFLDSVQNKLGRQSSSVRGKKHTTRVLWCTKFRHRLHDDEKVPYVHVLVNNAINWRNITNTILYIGLMTCCHKSLHLENIPSWSRLNRPHYVSKPFDLLEITKTFQLRKCW